MSQASVSPESVEAYWSALVARSSSASSPLDGNPTEVQDAAAGTTSTEDHVPHELRLLERLNNVRQLLQDDSTAGQAHSTNANRESHAGSGALEVGTIIDGYKVSRLLGRGGMAVVYSARQLALGRDVALKLIRTGPLATAGDLARFEAEAAATAALQHPGIVSVYDTGIWNGHHYFSMQLIQGPTRAAMLRDGPLDVTQAAELICTIAEAVHYAHRQGVLHRDLKPPNVIVDAERGQPIVADFGLAKMLTSDSSQQTVLTASGEMVGTPSYMSPEQALGDSKRVSPASDVYALGAIFYEMVTGRPPFRSATPIETIRQVVDNEPVPPRTLNSDVSRDVETICLKCLAKVPSARYASALELKEDVQRFLANKPIHAKPISATNRAVRWCRRNPLVAGLATLLIASLAAGTLVSSVMWRKSEKHARQLTDSRHRMRESVDRFQGRVFSDEAVYLQMSSKLRGELFDDVVSYLDEFSDYDSESAEHGEGEPDPITQSYLEVAQAAHSVEDYDKSYDASRRACDRICPLAEEHTKNAALWNQVCTAARLLFAAELQNSLGSPSAKAQQFLCTSLEAGSRAMALEPQNTDYAFNRLETEFIAIVENKRSYRKVPLAEKKTQQLEELNHQLESLDQPNDKSGGRIPGLTLRVRIGQMLLDRTPDSEFDQAFEGQLVTLKWLQEEYRRHQRRKTHTNAMRGRIFLAKARMEWSRDNHEETVVAFHDTEVAFRKAIEPCPNNRRWRTELASALYQKAEYHEQFSQFGKSRDVLFECFQNLQSLKESDPSDMGNEKRLILTLIQHGEISKKLDVPADVFSAFYTAAQECNLVITSQDSDPQWAWTIRAWALGEAMVAARQYQPDEQIQEIVELQESLIRRGEAAYGLDSKTPLAALHGTTKLNRPAIANWQATFESP